jgi:hypothetical protein
VPSSTLYSLWFYSLEREAPERSVPLARVATRCILVDMPTPRTPAHRRAQIVAAVIAFLTVCVPPHLHGQATGSQDSAAAPAARPEDVASMDAILHELYAVISGPAGPRDWQRFRSLFAPGARLIPVRRDSSGHAQVVAMTPDEFAQHAEQVFSKNAFYEDQIGQTVDTFGAVTQVFSAYASRHAPGGPPFARGINSIQLFNDGTRWYVVTIYWNAERPGLKIPAKYLSEN